MKNKCILQPRLNINPKALFEKKKKQNKKEAGQNWKPSSHFCSKTQDIRWDKFCKIGEGQRTNMI